MDKYKIGYELDRVTDELNESIVQTERAIADLKIGVRASVYLDDNPNAIKLIFGKHEGGWRILIEDKSGGETPLIKCNREVRVNAASRITDLLKSIVERAENELEAVREANEDVKRILVQLRAIK